ncbi:nucleoside-diphosphate sugar epimerase [Pseudomonas sp. S10E 269]|uniref:NAD-dependent epimerase/dehydratase family protein n=1 Tax=unclassified Pseudomonas TaxID=196821 RepID=UPI000C257521|nr:MULTISPECIES: NAD-dependent epimerase/dehydratase family protein [unclassified Pseudomonas]PJK34024.1 nucleoside-diphosphate sugar epimerase [Pseudomonas sp. S09F 262]PJK37965.1 nucleoside-diphosphate sugar epimerase [Pseudomonas sp. S10E 269]
MKALVLGANGFIGSSLIQYLIEQGMQVRVLTRKGLTHAHPSVETVIGDLVGNNINYPELLAGCDVIFNCAGEIHNEQLMHPLHVDATAKLLDAVAVATAQGQTMRWVQLSSVGAYGPSRSKSRVVTEDTPTNPIGTYEITKTLADSLILMRQMPEFFSFAILRPSNVFGPTMSNNSLRQLGQMVKRGRFFFIGFSPATATYIHVDDVVSALYKCATNPRAKGQVFNLSNDCMMPELIAGMARAQGVSTPGLVVPEFMVRLAVAIISPLTRGRITQKRVDALVSHTSYPAQKAMDLLEFAPGKPVPDSIGELFG